MYFCFERMLISVRQFIEIVDIRAREILDSRGNPTLEAQIITEE